MLIQVASMQGAGPSHSKYRDETQWQTTFPGLFRVNLLNSQFGLSHEFKLEYGLTLWKRCTGCANISRFGRVAGDGALDSPMLSRYLRSACVQ